MISLPRLLLLATIICAHSAHSQVVDKVRLSYDSLKITSRQTAITVSGDGRFLAFAYVDRTVKVFDVASNKFAASFKTSLPRLFDMKLSQSGDRLILMADSIVHVHDWRQRQTVVTFTLSSSITKVAFNIHRNQLAIGMKGGTVQIYDLEALRLLRTIENPGQQVSVLTLSPDGRMLVVGSMKKFNRYPLRLYEIVSGQLLASSRKAVYTTAFFDKAGTTLVTAGIDFNSPVSKVAIGAVYLTGTAYLLHNLLKVDPEFDASGTPVEAENEVAKVAAVGAIAGYAGWGTWNMLKSRTFVRSVNSSNFKRTGKISNKGQFAKVTYYLQGMVRDTLALMMTHTQSFDVFNTNNSRKIFTTTEDRKSYKASLDYLVTDQSRILPFGNGSKYLINTYKNNINQIYDAATNAIVGYIFSDSNEDFAIVSRDGRVDGTQSALSKIFWTSKNSTSQTPLESNFEIGFTPRLLDEIAHGKQMLGREFDIDEINTRIPSLKIHSVNGVAMSNEPPVYDQKQVRIVAQAHDNAEEITEVRLYQNGKLIGISPASANRTYEFSATLTSSFGEDNFFYCSAQSKSNIESKKEKFVLRYTGTIEAPTLYLVTVGINEYLNPKYNLNYARPDADSLEQSVRQTASSLITNIVTYSIRDNEAVKPNIAKAVNEISARAREQDILWFYYAGHGVLSQSDEKGEFYIVPYDVTQLYGNEDGLRDKAISAAELKAYSQSITAQKQIFILDACHSGGALNSASTRGGAEERAIAQMARSTGTFWLTSTGSDQFATELQKLGHGIFTYALLEGLHGEGDANKDQKLTVRELGTYVENKVPELSEKYKGVLQFPSAYSYGNDFPIAVYK